MSMDFRDSQLLNASRSVVLLAALACTSCATLSDDVSRDAPRVVHADVVAINQPIVYNRFGSLNPWGMVYALREDLADPTAQAGEARLKPDRRPRPLILRVAEGDELRIRFQNLLADVQRVDGKAICEGSGGGGAEAGAGAETEGAVEEQRHFTVPQPPDDPCTRRAGIAIVGMTPLDGGDPLQTGLREPLPGDPVIEYRFRAGKAGSHFFSSLGAVAGGEGDGGSLTHGLFGMVIVEPSGSRFYRSQVSHEDMQCARGEVAGSDCLSDPGDAFLDYEASRNGKPLLNMLRARADGGFDIVHGDLTAIVVDDSAARMGQPASLESRSGNLAWREFAIMFHDELKTVHHPDFGVLNAPTESASEAEKARHSQMVGTRDGFGINYGASGMGTLLIANRLGKGPARDCVNCAYEEFFLGSWANGDPALLADYKDDPSNVYHSYLGDRVKFHNVHAGPKETHVFHLHAHQWLSQTAAPGSASKGEYLDSQTVAPFQSFNYEIYYAGTGNRNLTPGDSIFHCHLYPHFAQGMWGLWRVHEVLEDGARTLPDVGGAWTFADGRGWGYNAAAHAGPGTNRETGEHGAGTPIPALVPLPGQAMPPAPTYANSPPVLREDGSTAPVMPGYPFYIAGKAGYRAPQAPRDLAEDAGLPRHVAEKPAACTAGINGCARIVPSLAQALDQGDMTFDIKKVKLTILPDAGDTFEVAAMNWHAGRSAGADPWNPDTPGQPFQVTRMVDAYRSGIAGKFAVNGLEAAPGAPFANPCPMRPGQGGHWAPGLKSLATGLRRYDVSAVELDLVVNQYGWHDKQARINVLSSDVPEYENRRRAADPFFFRAHSGECIEFLHTNRTPAETRKDAFQVATPTDVIGQHIHLVKFDVTASDGSANGYNYEDGTLARKHIEHMIEASHAPGGSAVMAGSGTPMRLQAKTANGKPVYQTSTQRWWADPLLDDERRDRTIGTVFTHDHFGASTIQQHGFYSALLIEPAGTRVDGTPWKSVWKKPDGSALTSGVGTQAIIETPTDVDDVSPHLRGVYREFALAVADFALLYDRNNAPIAPPHGNPSRPEAISVDHHDPYLMNYKNEPIPLRIGREGSGGWTQFAPDEHGSGRGDAANLFNSNAHRDNPNVHSGPRVIGLRGQHAAGDPSTEIFEAYEGDPVQVRMIQGAQEVQHVFTVHGQKWRRQNSASDEAWVSSQQIGISEHFEMKMQAQRTVLGSDQDITSDFLYHAGTIDALWNGAWGLFRSHASPETRDVAAVSGTSRPIRCRLADLHTARGVAADPECGGNLPAVAAGDVAPVTDINGLGGTGNAFRPPQVIARVFCIEAMRSPLDYNTRYGIIDPDAMRFRLLAQAVVRLDESDRAPGCPSQPPTDPMALAGALPVPGDGQGPLVLRMRSGEMAYVTVYNRFDQAPAPTSGNAVLPPIVSVPEGTNANDLLWPSARVGLHAALVSYLVRDSDAASVGLNRGIGANPSLAAPGFRSTSAWYAGHVETRRDGSKVTFEWKPFATRRGLVATLASMADPVRHPVSGLIGALVIEPENAELDRAYGNGQVKPGGTQARICMPGATECWDEFVLVYQDGLNLKQTEDSGNKPIPDCPVCDDSYDSGDIGLNFRTEPFWARLGLPREAPGPNEHAGKPQQVDLNSVEFPGGFLLPAHAPVATPTFCTSPGEQVVVHAVHPGGRARQRTFISYGSSYDDLGVPRFGSPSSSLLAPQRAVTMDLGRIANGLWLYRDGTAFHMAGGAWGYIDARDEKPDGACAESS